MSENKTLPYSETKGEENEERFTSEKCSSRQG
jgi:hypothetical protein